MSHELHDLLRELVEVWPDDHHNPVVEKARAYLEAHSNTESNEGYHQMTAYDSWNPSSPEVWYSL